MTGSVLRWRGTADIIAVEIVIFMRIQSGGLEYENPAANKTDADGDSDWKQRRKPNGALAVLGINCMSALGALLGYHSGFVSGFRLYNCLHQCWICLIAVGGFEIDSVKFIFRLNGCSWMRRRLLGFFAISPEGISGSMLHKSGFYGI